MLFRLRRVLSLAEARVLSFNFVGTLFRLCRFRLIRLCRFVDFIASLFYRCAGLSLRSFARFARELRWLDSTFFSFSTFILTFSSFTRSLARSLVRSYLASLRAGHNRPRRRRRLLLRRRIRHLRFHHLPQRLCPDQSRLLHFRRLLWRTCSDVQCATCCHRSCDQ